MAEDARAEGELVFTSSERGTGLATIRDGRILSLFEPTDVPLGPAPAGALVLAPSQYASGPRLDGVRLQRDEAGNPVRVIGGPP